MRYREYEKERDEEAVLRVMDEVGWLEGGAEDMRAFFDCGRSFVGELQGAVEACAFAAPGTVRYLDEELPLAAIGAVATSRVARKQGLAAEITAGTLAEAAADGTLMAGLGMFDQGFYNRLGFGTGPYELHTAFDPSFLTTEVRPPKPRRLGTDDWRAVHACRCRRRRGHGSVNIEPALYTRGEMLETSNGFGLGYRDGEGRITHHLWVGTEEVKRGPYEIKWMAWRTPEQFHELLGLIRGLGDQVMAVRMQEPRGIQLQDLLRRPLYRWRVAEGSKYATGTRGLAHWQVRMLDVPGCLALTRLPGEAVRFNLRLADPIEAYLHESAPWSGVAGDYVVTLGPESAAEPGRQPDLPDMQASVNAFTRLWLGVLPASGLSVTDDLQAGPALVQRLDHLLRLPPPQPDWEF